MRLLLLLAALLGAGLAHAQTPADAPLPPPPPDAPEASVAPPAAPPAAEGGDARAEQEDEVDESDEGDSEDSDEEGGPGPFWAAAAAGALPCVALDVVGGALTGLGCVFAHLSPGGGGDNCVESCVIGLVTAGLVVLGLILGGAGLVVLGPIAAIGVTIAAAVGSALAGRAWWGAALGGLPGVVVGAAGIALAGVGFSDMSIDSDGLDPGLFSSDPRSTLVLAGIGLAASAGLVALLGALLGDITFTALGGDEEGAPDDATSVRPPRQELPLALGTLPARVAY